MCFIYSTILCISYVPSAGRAAFGSYRSTHSSVLAWKIPWTEKEESGRLQSMRPRESDTTEWLSLSLFTFTFFTFTAHHGTSSVSVNKSPLTFRFHEKSASCSRRRTESSGSYMFRQSFLFYKKPVPYHLTAAFAVMIEACSGRL